jgi:hypothetical protein
MNKTLKGILYWTPRVLGILFVIFLSLFALDIFDMNLGLWGTIVGLFMHLIPSFVLVVALILAWRWEWVGTLLFFGFTAWYIGIAWGDFDLVTYLLIAGPPFLVGVLFLLGWVYRKQIKA